MKPLPRHRTPAREIHQPVTFSLPSLLFCSCLGAVRKMQSGTWDEEHRMRKMRRGIRSGTGTEEFCARPTAGYSPLPRPPSGSGLISDINTRKIRNIFGMAPAIAARMKSSNPPRLPGAPPPPSMPEPADPLPARSRGHFLLRGNRPDPKPSGLFSPPGPFSSPLARFLTGCLLSDSSPLTPIGPGQVFWPGLYYP